ncbi:MAG: YhdT family protein [Deltaproteobacteria bacterium]|jgi:uncharacterized membrane protein YhdT|nr:YhdT family protein [Deltaproteobacteria bacterium]
MSEKRFKQANREAAITLGLYAFFFLWWALFAFGLGAGDPADYTYVLGLPAWFFYSCVLGYPVLTLLLWLVVRHCFKDMPLDALDSIDASDSAEGGGRDMPPAGVEGRAAGGEIGVTADSDNSADSGSGKGER